MKSLNLSGKQLSDLRTAVTYRFLELKRDFDSYSRLGLSTASTLKELEEVTKLLSELYHVF